MVVVQVILMLHHLLLHQAVSAEDRSYNTKSLQCPGQTVATKLRGDNVDIQCSGEMIHCKCHVRYTFNRSLVRSLSGEMSGDQCKCSHHDVTSTQLVVTRAVCCSNTRSHVSGSDSQLVQCPANLPHVSRYRSRKREITCPAPSQPHKCVCLGEGYQTSRARGVISGNTCKCGSDTSVTRATCCHSEEQNKKFVIKLN